MLSKHQHISCIGLGYYYLIEFSVTLSQRRAFHQKGPLVSLFLAHLQILVKLTAVIRDRELKSKAFKSQESLMIRKTGCGLC